MAAYFKTKTVAVSRPVGQLEQSTPVTRTVNIQPSPRPDLVYERFGVEMMNPALLFDDAEAESYYEPGGRVNHQGTIYAVKAVRVSDTLATTSHTQVLMERIDDAA